MRWFIAGAATAAGAFLAASGGRSGVRRLTGRGERPELEAGTPPAEPPAPRMEAAMTPLAPYEPPLADDDTQELRLRIDETRDRIRRRTQNITSADADAAT